jgi:predicted flap endonuclease-1-like 5' DNA nuclease
MAALRSVRSEIYQAQAATQPGGHIGPGDDLKRIRGIGVLIEKKLNSMGVTAYEQIANWTAADIERVSHSLDFKGRIERENWVEQARILASGGATEFSRRVDKGEVETSRYRT